MAKQWSHEELDILRSLYSKEEDWDKILIALPTRTQSACRQKAARLNLQRPYRMKDFWSPEEEDLFKELYTTEPDWDRILKALPGRTRRACIRRAWILRLTRTTKRKTIGKQEPLPLQIEHAAYLAGVIDCDGTISLQITRNRNGSYSIRAYIGFYNTDKKMIIWIKDLLDQHVMTGLSIKEATRKRKAVYRLSVYSMSGVSRILGAVSPYLVQKTQQANIVLFYCENHQFYTSATAEELDLVKQIRKLNKRGNKTSY